jgi:hypothetical protein
MQKEEIVEGEFYVGKRQTFVRQVIKIEPDDTCLYFPYSYQDGTPGPLSACSREALALWAGSVLRRQERLRMQQHGTG